MSILLSNGYIQAGYARMHGMGGVTFNPALRASTGVAVGTTVGTNLIDGTLYLTKIEGPYPFATITGIGKAFSGNFTLSGGTAPAMCAVPVYYSDGTNLHQVGATIDLVSIGANTGTSPSVMTQSTSGVNINWTLPSAGLTLYVGFVVNLPYATGATGGVRVPAGQDAGANDWLSGAVELNFCTGGTGITTLSAIPSTIAVSSLSGSSLPSGPLLWGVKP